MVLLPDQAPEADAEAVAAKIVDALHAPYPVNGEALSVGASLGVAWYPEHGREPQELLRQADAAMYLAKTDDASRYRIARM